ncbi:MAG: stage II sporulation protein M [Myxococcota bacterium]
MEPGRSTPTPITHERSGSPLLHRATVDLGAQANDNTSTVDLWRSSEHTTTLAAFSFEETASWKDGTGLLFLEAFCFTWAGIAFGSVVPEQAGVVAVFLTAAALSSRFKRIGTAAERLAKGRRGAELLRAAGTFFSSFGGMFVAFSAYALTAGDEATTLRFGFALQAGDASGTPLSAERFHAGWGLVGHNLLVLASAYVLAMVYRGFGGLLALTWNACSWAVTFVHLVGGQMGPEAAVAALALAPHMAIEATAYALGALAGMRTGVYIIRRSQAALAGAWLLGWAALLCLAGALLEMFWPRWILSMWSAAT